VGLSGRFSKPPLSRASAIAHDFEQIAVEVQKIQAVMVAPIDCCRTFDTCLSEFLTRDFEIAAIHFERMMPFAQRVGDAIAALFRREWWSFHLEESKILRPALKQGLITQVGDNGQSQDFGIKALSGTEVVNFEPEMVEPFQLHQLIASALVKIDRLYPSTIEIVS
jgi:hypothetical protein